MNTEKIQRGQVSASSRPVEAAGPMTPEEMKAELKRLFKPVREFIDSRGIAGFLLSDPDTSAKMFGADVTPLPPRIKNVLWNYGSIYMIDEDAAGPAPPADTACPDCDTGWPEGRQCRTCHGTAESAAEGGKQ